MNKYMETIYVGSREVFFISSVWSILINTGAIIIILLLMVMCLIAIFIIPFHKITVCTCRSKYFLYVLIVHIWYGTFFQQSGDSSGNMAVVWRKTAEFHLNSGDSPMYFGYTRFLVHIYTFGNTHPPPARDGKYLPIWYLKVDVITKEEVKGKIWALKV